MSSPFVGAEPAHAGSVDTDLRRRVLSCLLLGFAGPVPPRWLLDALADGLGGVVLFGSNLGDGTNAHRLTAQLRTAAGRDIVVAVDEEGGDVTRLDALRGSRSPGAAALGHLDDEAVTERVYAAIGARCADAGITLDLAPVADVNLDPRNPVIGTRAFSADPSIAARHVAAAVRGIQSAGVAACVKHFPGHGATAHDSHDQVVTLRRSRAELDAVELLPFRAGIAAGTRALMTAHLLVPALDADRPATVSPTITRALLRDRLGFRGTVVTDALEMRAVAGTLGIVEGFVQALAAGADTIETGARDRPELVDAIPRAVAESLDAGRLQAGRLADAAARTAALALPGRGPDAATGRRPDVSIDAAADAARCLEIRGPLPDLVRPLVLECRAAGGAAAGPLPWSLGGPLAALVTGTETLSIDAVPADLDRRCRGRSLVAVVRDPQRHEWQRELIDAVARHPCAVLVDTGWPNEPVTPVPLVRTRGIAPGLLRAAARALAP